MVLIGVQRRMCSKPSFMLHLWLWIYLFFFFFKRNRKCNQQKLRVCKAFSKIIACKTSEAALLFWNNCFWKDWYLLTCKHWWSPRVHSHGEAERNQMGAAQVVAPPLTKIAAWFMNQLLYCCCSQLSIAFKVDLCTSINRLEMFRCFLAAFSGLLQWPWQSPSGQW